MQRTVEHRRGPAEPPRERGLLGVGAPQREVGLRVVLPALGGAEPGAEVGQRHPLLVGADAGEHLRVGNHRQRCRRRATTGSTGAAARRRRPSRRGARAAPPAPASRHRARAAGRRRRGRPAAVTGGGDGVTAGVAVGDDEVGGVRLSRPPGRPPRRAPALPALRCAQRRRRPTRGARGRRRAGRRREPAAAGSGGGRRGAPAHHAHKLPRRSCSRSMDSKSALKLPLPKPSEPCRSMISKNTVGRSPSGLVKICRR